ncbi:MAG: DUF6653 family protein [Candidatus Aenigmatarchaeota archaeon]
MIRFEQHLADIFGLDEDRWLRHANPLSVYSRYTVLPAIVISIWSRKWIETYFLVPLALSILWTYFNPRLFSKPGSLDNWASKAVLGERIWKDRESFGIKRDFVVKVRILNFIQTLGIPPLAWGLYYYEFWPILTGVVLLNLGKSWFLDRMVWLFEQHKNQKRVQEWLN